MWIRESYAGEAAVLFTWVGAVLPWSVTVLDPEDFVAVWIRFVPFRFLYLFGLGLPGERPFMWLWDVPGFVDGPVTTAAQIWIVGSAILLAAVAFSLVYYVAEERVESWPVDPVHTLGALLFAAGLVLSYATTILWRHHGGTTVPIGVVFLLAFGGILLLKVERPDDPDDGGRGGGDPSGADESTVR